MTAVGESPLYFVSQVAFSLQWLCQPCKLDAVVTDLHAALPGHLSALLEDLQSNQARLRLEMNSGMAASPGAGVNPKHVQMAESLTKSTINVSRELRAWAKATKETSQNLTIQERISLVAAFVKSLSTADRQLLDQAISDG